MKKLIHVLDKDKRKRKRVELFSNIPTTIQALGRSISAKIKDVSYSGIGIVLSPNQEFVGMESLETTIEFSNQLFQGRIANKIILPNQEVKIGLALPQEIHKEIDFNMTDSSWDKVTDLETVQNIYSDLAFKGPEAPIDIKQHFSTATLIPLKITESQTLICDVVSIHQGIFEKGKAKCTFNLFQTSHAFDTNIEKMDQSKMELKLSPVLARLLRRETVRILKKAANFELKIKLSNKSLQTILEKYEIFDYSEHGISMLDPEGDLSLPRNLSFEDAEIEIGGVGIISGRAEVRSYQWNRAVDAYIVGLKFEPNEEPHLTNWHNFILASRYPHLNFEYSNDDHEKIWSLFDTSGYLGHLDQNQSENLALKKKESVDTWKKLYDSGVASSKRIMVKKDGDVSAHLQLDQYYKDSWCVHHLAISKESSKIIAKDIYSAMTDFLSSRKTKYIITYHRPDLSWNQRNYHDFVKNYQYKHHNYMELFNLYDLNFAKFSSTESSSEIRIANEFDASSIYKYFTDIYQPFVLEALNIEQERMRLEVLESEFEKVKLVRGREFFVLTQNKKIKAFLQIEWGTHATNIFNLFDSMFVYVIEEVSLLDIYALIKKGTDFLINKGKSSALLLIRDDLKLKLVNDGLIYLCDENRWIAKSATLKRYQAYSQILYGHLLTQRDRIRKKNKDKK